MPVLLTATDFSDVANIAVNYTCNMANAYNASVIVFHSYIIPVTFNDTPMPVMPVEEGREIAEESMKGYIEKLKATFPDIEISGKVLYGDIVDSLDEYTEEGEQPWLVVLGNSAREDNSLWMGSTVLSALRNLRLPVMAIPPEAIFHPIKNICLAYDFTHVSKEFPSQQIINLVRQTNASLHVVSVNNNQGTTEHLNNDIQGRLFPIQAAYHFMDSDNVDKAIQTFVLDNHMDWLIVIPHKHSFFEGLFHKSHTKAMIQTSQVPLVSLHEEI